MSLDPHEEPAAIQTHIGAIFISLELSRSKWLITSLVPGGGQRMSKHWVEAGDLAGLLGRFWAIRDKVFASRGNIGLRNPPGERLAGMSRGEMDCFALHSQ